MKSLFAGVCQLENCSLSAQNFTPHPFIFQLSAVSLSEQLWLIGTVSTCSAEKLGHVLETAKREIHGIRVHQILCCIQKKGQLVMYETVGTQMFLTTWWTGESS